MQYLFELGNHPDLSRAEIQHVFLNMEHGTLNLARDGQYCFVDTKVDVQPATLMNRLGGTIKIAEAVGGASSPIKDVADFLDTHISGKIFFSLHAQDAKKTSLAIKKELKSRDRSVRYVQANNTATILHNNLVKRQGDLTIVNDTLFVTRAIQPIEDLSSRDYGRPGRDSKSGMIPPKLARILINISGAKPDDVLLDPFCGSGTILTEAAVMGFSHLVGSDISKKAVEDTTKNLVWLQEKIIDQRLKTRIFLKDVRQLTSANIEASVDAIITEPYLGKPLHGNETKPYLQKQARELSALYRDAFESFSKIAKKGVAVVIVIPQFKHADDWVTVDCLKDIKKIGFTPIPLLHEKTSLLYHRKGQRVGRMVLKFQKL
jgi:tRNA G10  N-methylase Trm11